MMRKIRNLFAGVLLAFVCIITLASCGKAYTLTYISSVGGSVDGEVVQTVKAGENASKVTAVAEEGFLFIQWSDGMTGPNRTDINVNADKTICAIFDRAFDVTFKAGDNGTLTGGVKEITQKVVFQKDSTIVTATPAKGYAFDKWSDGVTTAARSIENVTANVTVTAIFVVAPATE